jgi:hypothetical protein
MEGTHSLGVETAARLAYVSSGLSLIGLVSHIPFYASATVVPFTRSHSIPVEGLGVVNFFVWSIFLTAVYDFLAPRAGRLARVGLALGIAGTSYLCILHVLYALEVVWFSDTFGLFVIGGLAWMAGLGTALYLTRVSIDRAQDSATTGIIQNLLGIAAFPLWQVLLWRRISGKLKGEIRASANQSRALGLVGDQERT